MQFVVICKYVGSIVADMAQHWISVIDFDLGLFRCQ